MVNSCWYCLAFGDFVLLYFTGCLFQLLRCHDRGTIKTDFIGSCLMEGRLSLSLPLCRESTASPEMEGCSITSVSDSSERHPTSRFPHTLISLPMVLHLRSQCMHNHNEYTYGRVIRVTLCHVMNHCNLPFVHGLTMVLMLEQYNTTQSARCWLQN